MINYTSANSFDKFDKKTAIDFISTADGFDVKQLSKISAQFDELATILVTSVKQLNLQLSANQCWQLLIYLDTLLVWNKAYNLTAITDPIEAMIKHVVDCLAIIPTLDDANIAQTDILDIGTGAGLPAVIIAICQPDRICTPLDSNQKKIRFIRQVVGEINLKNVKATASRIQQYQGSHQVITSRAFSSLEDFVELAEPFLAESGYLLAMKGKEPTQTELDNLSGIWAIEILPLNVPYLQETRHIIKLHKK